MEAQRGEETCSRSLSGSVEECGLEPRTSVPELSLFNTLNRRQLIDAEPPDLDPSLLLGSGF